MYTSVDIRYCKFGVLHIYDLDLDCLRHTNTKPYSYLNFSIELSLFSLELLVQKYC